MNKEQVIAKAALKGNMTQREIRNSLNAVIEVLVEAFENDVNVAIAGLGTFQVRKRCNVKKYLPENGKGPVKGVAGERAMVVISDRKYIRFNPSLQLREKCINKSSQSTEPEDRASKSR